MSTQFVTLKKSLARLAAEAGDSAFTCCATCQVWPARLSTSISSSLFVSPNSNMAKNHIIGTNTRQSHEALCCYTQPITTIELIFFFIRLRILFFCSLVFIFRSVTSLNKPPHPFHCCQVSPFTFFYKPFFISISVSLILILSELLFFLTSFLSPAVSFSLWIHWSTILHIKLHPMKNINSPPHLVYHLAHQTSMKNTNSPLHLVYQTPPSENHKQPPSPGLPNSTKWNAAAVSFTCSTILHIKLHPVKNSGSLPHSPGMVPPSVSRL